MRKCIEYTIDGLVLRGTCHEPAPKNGAGASSSPKIGILNTNPGYLPRNSRGDLAVLFSDSFARAGYWTFRFDLPGLGDSDGEVPAEVMPFIAFVQGGGHEQWLLKLAREVKKQNQLDALIMFGHCGSASGGAFASAADDENIIAGGIFFEPVLIIPELPKRATAPNGHAKPAATPYLKLARASVRTAILRSPLGPAAQLGFRRIKHGIRRIRGQELPSDTNFKLLKAWKSLLNRDFPMLVLCATNPSVKRNRSFDYCAYLGLPNHPRVTFGELDGTNHSFVEGGGREAALDYSLKWLQERFPVVKETEACAQRK